MNINNLYIGIPESLKKSIFWVNQDYRLNDLSFNSGGTVVVINYVDGRIYGYDKIKYPASYVRRILNKENKAEVSEELKWLKKEVKSIHAFVYDINDQSNKLEEIWNSNSNELPYNKLKLYTYNLYEDYLNFFTSELDFAIKYISIYYPLEYYFINNNWHIIEKGNAFYSVYLDDIDFIYTPDFGLSFNKNIRWNSKLRAKYDYGFENPYKGCIVGTGKEEKVEYEDRDYLDTMLPLDIKKELSIRDLFRFINSDSEIMLKHIDDINFESYEDKFDEEFAFLDIKDFKKLYENNKFKILINQNIWINTLSKIIDEDFVELIFEKVIIEEIE